MPDIRIPQTREEAESMYLDDLQNGSSARQAIAFKLFGDRMHHIGYLAGVRDGGAAARQGQREAFAAVFGGKDAVVLENGHVRGAE